MMLLLQLKKAISYLKHLQSEIGYYQGFSIVFEPPIGLVANTEYNLKAFITGPSSSYGESGLTNVEHSGVNFVFKINQ